MKYLLLLSLFFLTVTVYGQIMSKESQGKDSITFFEKPEFPRGEQKMMEFISMNAVFPESAKRMKSTYRVYVDVSIDSLGNVANAKIIKSITKLAFKDYMNDLNDAALNVISIMPKWKPAKVNGKAISTHLPIRVTFSNKLQH